MTPVHKRNLLPVGAGSGSGSFFKAGGAHFGEEGLGGNAEFFGGPSLVPAELFESIFEQDTLDVKLSAGGDFVKAAFPGKGVRDQVCGCSFRVHNRWFADQKLTADFGPVGQDDGALEGVLQFADIAGPGVVAEAAASVVAQGERRFTEFAAEFLEEVVSENINVIAAVAKRRYGERDGGDAEVKVFAKEFFADAGGEIAVGGDDDADVHVDGLRAANSFEAAFLEDPEKLGLAGQRELANFVKEESATLGEFDFANFAVAGSGEGAAFVTEEFVFNEAFGNGGAV